VSWRSCAAWAAPTSFAGSFKCSPPSYGPLKDVDFRLTPVGATHAAVFGGPFIVLRFPDPTDQDVVYQEGRDGATYLESDREVERYLAKFRSVATNSLSRAESIDRIREQADQLD